MSALEFRPRGLLDPVSWRNRACSRVAAMTRKGSKKWNAKNRVSVALSTEKPPQIHCTRASPTYGTADKRFVITVAPQNDIWPHGRTYPTKAVIITRRKRMTPMFHVSLYKYEP